MRRLIGSIVLSIFLASGAVPVYAQTDGVSIRLLDRQGKDAL